MTPSASSGDTPGSAVPRGPALIPGDFTIGVCDVGIAVPQGFDRSGLLKAAAGAPAERAMLRPEALKGRVLALDPTAALAAALAVRFRASVFAGTPSERLGVVIASRYGSAATLREFADRVRRGSSAPAAFAAAGYNASAGFAAMAAEARGPSLAVAGHSASLRLAVQRAALYIERGDADAMMAIACESRPGDTMSLALGVALRHPEAAPLIVSDTAFAAPGIADIPPDGPFSIYPWLWPGSDSLFAPVLSDLAVPAAEPEVRHAG